jgi:PAS domain S-box-containing protein
MSMSSDQSLDATARLLATSAEPAFIVDLEGRIVYWNRAAGVFFGIPASEAVGRPCAMIVRGLSTAGEIQCTRSCPLLARASQDDTYSVAEMQVPSMPRPAGWSRMRVHHVPLENDSGETGYVLHVLTEAPGGRPGEHRST